MNPKTSLELTHGLFQIMKQLPRLKWRQSSSKDLTRSEYELLGLLVIIQDDENRSPTVTELSNMIQITPAGVTHLVNSLEESGCIERLRDPNDRRVVQVGLTQKGIEFAGTLISEAQEHLIGLVNYLGEEDSHTLIRLMSQMIEYFTTSTDNNE
jgi:DNA-binding MarR family transcriptional regulator